MRRALVLTVLGLSACAGPQSALDPAGDQARLSGDMGQLLLWVCGFMYLVVLVGLGVAIWRARHALAGPPVADGAESAAEPGLRRGLIVWAAVIVAGLFVLAAGSFLIDRRLAEASENESVRIKVTGAQWWWKVEYVDPVASRRVVTANEIHLPVGRRARIELHADDVIHSFWLPSLAGKLDLIPGRTNVLSVTPRRVGLFRGQCAEFCGLQHALMGLDVTVESPEAFEAWKTAQRRPADPPLTPPAQAGQRLFLDRECASCHQIQGTPAGGQTGPNLTHLASRRSLAAGALPNDRAQLIAWLHDTQAVKPGAHMPTMDLSDAEVDALVAYLRGLK